MYRKAILKILSKSDENGRAVVLTSQIAKFTVLPPKNHRTMTKMNRLHLLRFYQNRKTDILYFAFSDPYTSYAQNVKYWTCLGYPLLRCPIRLCIWSDQKVSTGTDVTLRGIKHARIPVPNEFGEIAVDKTLFWQPKPDKSFMYRKGILKILWKSDEKWQSYCANEPNNKIHCSAP